MGIYNYLKFAGVRLLLLFVFCINTFELLGNNNQRVIVLTDIEADPDDTQSLIRLLLYSNQIDVKGLIAVTSTHLKNNIYPESINRVIEAYKKVRPNLLKHESNYPSSDYLYSCVKKGVPVYGMQGVGDDFTSEGSEWIIKELQVNDDRPLWISVWGGANVLAQALYDIQKRFSEAQANELICKLRVYSISDQDDAGIWIRNKFPSLFYIVSPGGRYGSATWPGINDVVKGLDNSCVSNKWILDNIQQGHGPLGAAYPDVAWGMEGDTPAIFIFNT